MYGLGVIDGQALIAMTFCIMVKYYLARYKPTSEIMQPLFWHDLGNMTLAMVMLWAYFGFSQYLIIWSGNLPEEIDWYQHRLARGWQAVGLAIVILHFGLPFLLLLSRALKRHSRQLARAAGLILLLRVVDLFWLIAPAFRP